MGKIVKNGINYSGAYGSGSDNSRILTLAEYNALPDTKLTDGVVYYITDVAGIINADSVGYDNTTSGLVATNVQGALDEIDGNVDAINDTTIPELVTNIGGINIVTESLILLQTVSTTATTVSTYEGRRFSDYQLILLKLQNTNADVRATMLIPSSQFRDTNISHNISCVIGSIGSNANKSMITCKYNTDTSVTLKLDSDSVCKLIQIAGIKLYIPPTLI